MNLTRRILISAVAACAAVCIRAQQVLTVDSLFQLVEQNSKALQVQKTGQETARLALADARSQRLPDISTALSVSYNGNVLLTDRDFGNRRWEHSPHFGNSFSVQATQLIYAGGAVDAAIKMASLGTDQAEAQTHSTREQMRFTALSQYLDLYKLQNSIEVVESNIALTEKLIADIQARYDEGMALRSDITRYELQMKNLQLQLVKLRDQRNIQNYQLCHTLGLSTETEIVADESVAATAYGGRDQAEWQQTAAAQSPSLRLASLNTQMAVQGERMARSELLPKISFIAADNFNGPITYELPPVNKNINVWYFGVGLNYSLSSLFKNNKKLRQARSTTLQSRQAQALAAEQLDNNVQQAYTEYMQSYVELETQQQSVRLANENYQVVNERYLNQLSLLTDMLDASSVKLDAELSEVDARINVAYNYYKMKYIAGTL